MQDAQVFCDTLKEKYKLKIKGVGPISTISDVDTPEMKMGPLLQIEENMLVKSMSLTKNVWKKQRRQQQHL